MAAKMAHTSRHPWSGSDMQILDEIDPRKPVLIAGPTASGKSTLALAIARTQGGMIVNADALQVYARWRILTARPAPQEEALAPHRLFGHVKGSTPYSVGHWLREVGAVLTECHRPIIVGGSGLYFSALTEGLADIPAVPKEVRAAANHLRETYGPGALLKGIDNETRQRIDTLNPMRVQRAWEVLQATGRGLASWQEQTAKPLLALSDCEALLLDADKTWLNDRILKRFENMLEAGGLEEVRANLADWSPTDPSCRAIGAPDLVTHLRGNLSLEAAREQAVIATRQYAKRQRSWFRTRMQGWRRIAADKL